jgi:hypothetical protein
MKQKESLMAMGFSDFEVTQALQDGTRDVG